MRPTDIDKNVNNDGDFAPQSPPTAPTEPVGDAEPTESVGEAEATEDEESMYLDDEDEVMGESSSSINRVMSAAFGILPDNHHEAMQMPDADEWRKAEEAELASMEKMEVWDLVDRPTTRKTVKCKWVYL